MSVRLNEGGRGGCNHPEDGMSYDVNGKCEFQDLITRYNVSMPARVCVGGGVHWCLCV